jgi:hypothetical protein
MCTNYRYDWSNYVVYLITLHTLAMLLFLWFFTCVMHSVGLYLKLISRLEYFIV